MIAKQELRWRDGDRAFSFRGLEFVTVHGGGAYDGWVPGENCFLFYKTRALVEQYLAFFAELPADGPPIRRVVELGLYDGGSVPFWFEALEPEKHVGIDIRPRGDTPLFEKYRAEGDRRSRIETHWGTSQSDRKRVPALVDAAFGEEPIDLVIDDASHLYAESKASFELLFPRLRPGGWYLIEDWAWSHWRGIEREGEWKGRKPLTHLVFDLVEATGSTKQHLVRDLRICSGFAAVRRGWATREELGDFAIDRHIYRYSG